MKYFMDFEFLEGDVPVKLLGYNIPKWLIKPNNTIQPISIGLVCSDGREYYAISKDFNLKEAWYRYDEVVNKQYPLGSMYNKVYWIRDNVLKPIFIELRAKEVEEYNIAKRINIILDFPTYSFSYKNFKRLINKYGKTNKQIAKEIKEFVGTEETIGNWNEVKDKMNTQFYGYYSDYDWVVFCWLFGKMIDLPNGFPMFAFDLKQALDEKCVIWAKSVKGIRLMNFNEQLDYLKKQEDYPKQTNEHNALSDARFNYELYKFLNTL